MYEPAALVAFGATSSRRDAIRAGRAIMELDVRRLAQLMRTLPRFNFHEWPR